MAGPSVAAAGTPVTNTNKFQSAISAWRNLDFTTLVSNLDNTASEIVTYQRDSTVQRKDLAQKTKDFRKLDDATKLVEIKGLLKAYQTFIDLLTNHSKSINSSFIHAYNALSEAPDPYPLLEASVDSMLLAEDTLPKLSEENQHLQKTVTQLTAQLEDTESRLQTERAARKELEDNLESRVKEVEATWIAVIDEKKDNWAAKEKALEDKLEHQERLLSGIRANDEVNERLGKSSSDSGETSQRAHVMTAELEMVNSELERTSTRLAEVEARNEQLRLDLAEQAKKSSSQSATTAEDDPAYMRMRSENSSLMRKLDASRVEKEALKRDLDARLRGLEREVALLREERENLRVKVQRWSDYDDMKQELEVLKSIEFATGDDDDGRDDDGGDAAAGGVKAKGDTLEQLLLARNKKLSDELTILRVSHQDLQTRLQDLQEELSRTNVELEKSHNLNEKLENDLSTMHAETANAFPSNASHAGTYVSRFAPSVAGGASRRAGGGRTSPTSSIISGFAPTGGIDREPMGGGSGILPMITAQRDRFKKRNAQLELELSESHRNVSQLRQEIAALQKDNLNLYEKSRYVQSYNRGGIAGGMHATAAGSGSPLLGGGGLSSGTSAFAAGGGNPNPSSVSIGGGSGPIALDRYRKAYESNLSPFAAFRGRESARAYKRMSLPERVVYSVTRMVLATRASRNLFAAYCVALHFLVFMSLYWLGTVDVENHASKLVGVAAAAAGKAAAHGEWRNDDFKGT